MLKDPQMIIIGDRIIIISRNAGEMQFVQNSKEQNILNFSPNNLHPSFPAPATYLAREAIVALPQLFSKQLSIAHTHTHYTSAPHPPGGRVVQLTNNLQL